MKATRADDYVARHPRHKSEVSAVFSVRVCPHKDTALSLPAELVDISRNGVGVHVTETPGEIGDDVTIVIRHPTSGWQFREPAVIRWMRFSKARGQWTVGCMFQRELPLEVLGDFFLEGLLRA